MAEARFNDFGEKYGHALRTHLDELEAIAKDGRERAEAWAKVEEKKAAKQAYLLGEKGEEELDALDDRLREIADDAPEGSHEEAVAEARADMAEEGATEAEIQEAEASGALVAGDIDDEGNPQPTPGSDADVQTGQLDKDEKAVPEDERDSQADEQRAVLDLSAPDEDKREAAIEARAQDEGRPAVEDLREDAGLSDDASRASALAAKAKDTDEDARAELEEQTNEELKAKLKAQGKPVSGNKTELIDRLLEDDSE